MERTKGRGGKTGGGSALVAEIRSFNRFYTHLLGLLNETLLDSPVSLTEARILWEISARPGCRAEDLILSLGVDRGYLSRILRSLEKQGLVSRQAHASDARMRLLALSPAGLSFMRRLDAQASRQIVDLLRALGRSEKARLVASMRDIQGLLSPGLLSPGLQRPAAGRTMPAQKKRRAHP